MAGLMEEYYLLSQAEEVTSGHVYDAAVQAAETIGVEKPLVFTTPSKMSNAFAGRASDGKNIIGMTEGFLEKTGAKYSATPELRAFLGHEIGHLVDTPLNNRLLRKAPMMALPVLAVAIYHSIAHRNLQRIQGSDRHTDDPTEVSGWINQSNGFMHPSSRKMLIKRDAHVALGAFCGGAVLSNVLGKEMEFMCDRYGAMVSSPEAVKSMLYTLEANAAREEEEFIKSKTPQELLRIFLNFDTFKQIFQELTYSSHPSTEARIARMDKLAAKIAEENPKNILETARNLEGVIMPLLEKVMKVV